MDLRHARYFVAIADAGSVNAAAAAVHVAQPSLSRQLRDFERELGVELFERTGRRLAISPAGRALLPEARALLAQADQLRELAAFHSAGRLRHLTIAAPTVTLTDVVAPFVATLSAVDPDVDILQADGLTAAQAMERGADLVIQPHPPSASLAVLNLPELPVWAYLPGEDEWASQARVDLPELLDRRLICQPMTSASRQAIDLAIRTLGTTEAREICEVANGTLAQALAAAGRGIAIASDDPRFGLSRLAIDTDNGPLRIALRAMWHPGHAGAATLADTARRLHDFVTRRYPAPVSTTRRLGKPDWGQGQTARV